MIAMPKPRRTQEAMLQLQERLARDELLDDAIRAVRNEVGVGLLDLTKAVERACSCTYREAARAVARATFDLKRYEGT